MEKNNERFDLKSKLESMIKMSKEIINEYERNEYQGEPPVEICLAYDVYSYLPKINDLESYFNFIFETYILEDDKNLDESAKELKKHYKYVLDDLELHSCIEIEKKVEEK